MVPTTSSESTSPGANGWSLIRLPERTERNFAAKVNAFNAGYDRVKSLSFDVIGNLDADVSFCDDYIEYLLSKFEANSKLGVAGTHYIEGDFHSYRDSYINVQHVNGQVQLFRRACYEDIGGYVPIKGGGIDWVAVTTARMKGWATQSFADRDFHHHRKMGTAGTSELGSRFHYGKKGLLPGWASGLADIPEHISIRPRSPTFWAGVCLLSGYVWCWATRHERPISAELMRFHRKEQMDRLRKLLPDRFGVSR